MIYFLLIMSIRTYSYLYRALRSAQDDLDQSGRGRPAALLGSPGTFASLRGGPMRATQKRLAFRGLWFWGLGL